MNKNPSQIDKIQILLEDLESKFNIINEGIQILNEKFDRKFNELKTDFKDHKKENYELFQELFQKQP
jgi:hypothetical protein